MRLSEATRATAGARRPAPAELEALAARYAETRDARLRNRLIEAHQSLVEGMAARFCRRGAPLEDLIQVATIGLIQALDRYDPAARGEVHDVRGQHHRRRDQALLSRLHLVGEGAAPASGDRRQPDADR